MDFAYFRNSLRILADRNVYLCRSKCVHSSRFCLQELPEAMKWGRLNSVLKRRTDCIKSVPWDLWEFICEGFLWSTYPANIYLFKVNNRNTKKVWNIFKVNNKDTRTTSMTSFWYIFVVNSDYFTHFSSVPILYFEQINVCCL